MSLERIVRSFQLPEVAPPKRVIDPTRDDTDAENAILVVGKGGTVRALQGGGRASTSRYMEQINRERTAEEE